MKPADAVRRLQSRPKSLSGLSSHLQFVTNAAGRRRKKPAIAPDDFLYQLKRVSLPNERAITGYLTFSSNGDDQHQHLYESHWESALDELRELGAALKVGGGVFCPHGVFGLRDADQRTGGGVEELGAGRLAKSQLHV